MKKRVPIERPSDGPGNPTTLALGEEGPAEGRGFTTLAVGEEDRVTTLALGEEDPTPSSGRASEGDDDEGDGGPFGRR